MPEEKSFYVGYMKLIDALLDKHALEISVHDLSKVSGFADVFIVAISRSELNSRTLIETAEDILDSEGAKYRVEGEHSSKWTLIDAGDLIINVLSVEGSRFYRLDSLWGDVPTKKFEGYED